MGQWKQEERIEQKELSRDRMIKQAEVGWAHRGEKNQNNQLLGDLTDPWRGTSAATCLIRALVWITSTSSDGQNLLLNGLYCLFWEHQLSINKSGDVVTQGTYAGEEWTQITVYGSLSEYRGSDDSSETSHFPSPLSPSISHFMLLFSVPFQPSRWAFGRCQDYVSEAAEFHSSRQQVKDDIWRREKRSRELLWEACYV